MGTGCFDATTWTALIGVIGVGVGIIIGVYISSWALADSPGIRAFEDGI